MFHDGASEKIRFSALGIGEHLTSLYAIESHIYFLPKFMKLKVLALFMDLYSTLFGTVATKERPATDGA